MPTRFRLAPVSTRHAFALAFDLAFRRDLLHSIAVPLLIRAPWIALLALLPSPELSDRPGYWLVVSSAVALADYAMHLLVTGMLRVRARAVFDALPQVSLPPAAAGYLAAARRVPWLFVTEVVRNMAILFAIPFLVVPAVFLGFRLSFATEAVVLNEPHLAGAFSRSFRLTPGRFERWLEMIVISVLLVLGPAFALAAISLLIPGLDLNTLATIPWISIALVTPVVQYAWTFFYLRLVEVDSPGVEVGPAYAAAATSAEAPGTPTA